MKCSAYITTSLDGFIAQKDGNIDWLDTAGNPDAEMGEDADMGFFEFINSVDCMIMGRKTMEVISKMNLSEEMWPYGYLRIIVLSKTLKEPPVNLNNKVEIYSGDIKELVKSLEEEGYEKIYVDGRRTIQSFMDVELINEMTILRAPFVLGAGISLFDRTTKSVKLEKVSSIVFPNDFIQENYFLNY